MNTIRSKDMLIYLEDQQLESVTYIDQPKPVLLPLELVNSQNDKLKGFIWKMEERPMKRADIFTRKQESLEIENGEDDDNSNHKLE